jgi:sarcosine oxidase subunit beta
MPATHNSSPDVVIAGGGVIGTSIAMRAALGGLRVMLIERSGIGSGGSRGNPGVVSLATKAPGINARLARASLSLFPCLVAELDADVGYSQMGSLVVIESEPEDIFMRRRCDELAKWGIRLEPIDAPQARSIQPLLGGPFRAAIWSAPDAMVDPLRLTEASARAAVDRGAEICLNEAVLGVQLDGDRVVAVRTDRRTTPCRWFVNAAGVDAPSLGATVGLEHAIVPRKGQLLATDPVPGVPPVRVTHAAEIMLKHGGATGASAGVGLAPQPDGCHIISGTHEDVGLDATLDPVTLSNLALRAARLFPRLAGSNISRAWCGFRPSARTGSPLLGAEAARPGYVIAGGHGGDGIALAPITARYISTLLERDEPDLSMDVFLDELEGP